MASLEEIRNERLRKISILKDMGVPAYPIVSNFDATLSEAGMEFAKLSKRKKPLTLVGRVMSVRGQGALMFFDLNDGTGLFQGLLKKGEIEDAVFELFRDTVDIGDFIEVSGSLFITKRKEKTILVSNWRMLSKSLRPLPDKWHGLQDVEERFRRRYLDTLMSPEVRERFLTRSTVISEIRTALTESGFLEVETPLLQPLAGGATAEPFSTHHNALDIDLFLRIAPELYLKELLVGGFRKVFELGRNFRNEGIDVTHNPEFTMLEFYEAYSDAKKAMKFVEALIRRVAKKVAKKGQVTYGEEVIDFAKPFAVVSYADLLKRYALIQDIMTITKEELTIKANQLGVLVAPSDAKEKIIDNIYKKTCRPRLIQPTYIVDYPVEFSPFAKRKEDDQNLIDRFQLVVGGFEVVNAFSELNDPSDQRERYVEQDKKKRAGEGEVSPSDEGYLESMEYGMPPAAGVGIGIDRLVMILTNTKNIKEVILFPTMRPRD
jgi:lysyl-tRNA synthetase class 2